MSTPATQAAVLDRIRSFARARAWTPGRLAAEAGLSRGTLSRLFDKDWLPSSTTVLEIEKLIPEGWHPDDDARDAAPKRGKSAQRRSEAA